MILFLAGIIVTVVTIVCHRQKPHLRNQETPQGSCFVHMCFLASPLILSTAAVYKEPYDGAVSRLPQMEHAMEECPANRVLTKINEDSLS